MEDCILLREEMVLLEEDFDSRLPIFCDYLEIFYNL